MTGDGSAERSRLTDDHAGWMRWGPYLAERAWGTVREDYSPGGSAWDYFPHDHARSRAYRWNEDGMAGVCDDAQRLCLALALWNGVDPILKERMFGLTGPQGRHGEDVKEYWWYADAVPSQAYLKWQYAYPLDGYPYQGVIDGNAAARLDQPEFELLDTGVFDPEPGGVDGSARWADVTVEYAKAAPDDIVMRIRVENMSVRPATVHALPTLWFRNTWSWGPDGERGSIRVDDGLMVARHPSLGSMLLAASAGPDGVSPTPLFCDNESNAPRLWDAPRATPWPKDGINDHVVAGRDTVNPALTGTKAALWYRLDLPPRGSAEVVVRLTAVPGGGAGSPAPDTGDGARAVLDARRAEADDYHASLLPASATDGERAVHRAATAGLVWGKCFYYYDVDVWMDGDPYQPTPPALTSIPTSPRRNCCSSAGSGTCTRTDSSPRTSGPSATPTRRCTPGRPCGCSRSTAAPTSTSSRRCCTSCCSTSPGGSTARTLRATTFSRAGSSGWTTSVRSTAATPCRTASCSNSPTARPGWRCTAWTSGRCACCSGVAS